VDWIALGGIAAASAVNSALPGPCIALTLARTARGGATAGICVTSGIIVANLVLVLSAFAVLHGALDLSGDAAPTLKWLGAAVMIAFALRILYVSSAEPELRPKTLGPSGDIAAGLVIGVSSPYNLVFYLALLPLYAQADSFTGLMVFLASAAAAAGAAVSYGGTVAAGLGSRRLCGASGRWVERAGAICLIGFCVLAFAVPPF
jgi:threonine/homoserine/homoserine lactone efflux protein